MRENALEHKKKKTTLSLTGINAASRRVVLIVHKVHR